MRKITQRINVRQKLIAQSKIFFENRLGLFAIGPYFIKVATAVRAHVGLKRCILEPANIEFGVVVIMVNIFTRITGIDQRWPL